MAAKTWIGKTGSDWDVSDSWNPIGVPQRGDQVVIASGGPRVKPDQPPLVDLQITLGGTDFAGPAFIKTFGARFESSVTITVPRMSPYAALYFEESTTFDGTLTVVGGQISFEAGAGFQGSGRTFIEKGATVTVTGALPKTQTVTFRDANGTLALNDPSKFSAHITGVQPGDRIVLGRLEVAVSASYGRGELQIEGELGRHIATLTLLEAISPLSFYATPSGNRGSTLSTSRQSRIWSGGSGDWYDSSLWESGVPMGGDRVSIPSGTIRLSEADAKTYGTIDAENITLGRAGNHEPVTLEMTNASFGPAAFISTRGHAQHAPDYIQPQVTMRARGTTRLDGALFHEAHGGKLTIASQSDDPSSRFIITGFPPAVAKGAGGTFATIFVSRQSRLEFAAGTFINNGLILVEGSTEIGQDAVFQGAGTIQIQADGSVSVLGSVSGEQKFVFNDGRGALRLGNLAKFKAAIEVASCGNKIHLPNLQARSLSYDQAKQVLVLIDGDGKQIGEIRTKVNSGGLYWITGPDIGELITADFTLSPDGKNGSTITFTPHGAVILRASLPMPAVGTTGTLIPMKTLLRQAFGTVPPGYAHYGLSGPSTQGPDESYWEQPPKGTPTNSGWCYDGLPITGPMTIPASDLDRVSFYVGNRIDAAPVFTVSVATDSAGKTTEYIQYSVWTVNPSVCAPETAYDTLDPNLPGSAARFGRPEPGDVVSSAYRYNAVYRGVVNHNNCNWISDNVTAGAGAVQPYDNASTDPANNVSGGFWRIVYRGSDVQEPIEDWTTVTRPGDVVRMSRLGAVDGHTTTVVGTLNPDASIAVYDNALHDAEGKNLIGAHEATYWTGTDPASITIYRLDPNHQYLIEGTSQSEFIQGSVFNNLICPGGGQDIITAGPGNNEIRDITAHLNGITVTDFHSRDTLNFTDLSNGDVTTAFAEDILTVSRDGVAAAKINLPRLASGAHFVSSPNGNGGTLIRLAGTP
jgi:hypothetical protein